jgi:SNF2 family DNA or RNA helicase
VLPKGTDSWDDRARLPAVPPDSGVEVYELPLSLPLQVIDGNAWGILSIPKARDVRLLHDAPWVRSLGRLEPAIGTESWKFPAPPIALPSPTTFPKERDTAAPPLPPLPDVETDPATAPRIRLQPTAETVHVKDRLLFLLQPPLDGLFQGRQLQVPFAPFPYQLEGIAFLVPRSAALLADEMGLGKTCQAILALRLLFYQGVVRRALVVCPKSLVHNWVRELKLWAPDVPLEVIEGEPEQRRSMWLISNCPLKLVNYETLTRDVEWATDSHVFYDVVILDEAQRIKNKDSKTSQAARALPRGRSWALTGTPIENHPDDLVHLFEFLDPGRIPPDTPPKRLPLYTADSILRRTKETVQSDMPPKIFRDVHVDLTPAQRDAYRRAEEEGVVHLNSLGDTITVQHVFQLVMRLKQICNFDPLTGESAKLEQLRTDMEEVADSGHKAIIFSQWVEPLQILARHLESFGPLQYHGRIPPAERPAILERFRHDPDCHVLLMSYGTGSVGLNLQCANYVFLFDRWWNPAVEDQAINRAHRVGQRHPVTVTRFLAQDTIEHRIAEILESKRKIFLDLLAQADKPSRFGLTEEEIFSLFDIKARPRRHPGVTSH